MSLVTIDGSGGEGGGQILRTALSLSCIFGKPFRIVNLRKNRRRPGLLPQHLMAVRAAAMISGADVRRNELGSTELSFTPGPVRGGEFGFDVGTAGSAPLVLQTLVPPLLFAKGKSVLVVQGGTHVPFSPSWNYLSEVFLPFIEETAGGVRMSLSSCGFYPRGGGRIRADIVPSGGTRSVVRTQRGALKSIRGVSGVANLPSEIAVRQKESAMDALRADGKSSGSPIGIAVEEAKSPGPGTFLFLAAESEHAVAGFTSLGALGKRAEAVGSEGASELLSYLKTDAAFDPHLADQVVPYLALSRDRSIFTTSMVTEHLRTNLWIASLFIPFRYDIEGNVGEPGKVTIR